MNKRILKRYKVPIDGFEILNGHLALLFILNVVSAISWSEYFNAKIPFIL